MCIYIDVGFPLDVELICIMKENNLLALFEDGFDLDDFILDDIGDVVSNVVDIFGSNSIEIELPDNKKIILDKPSEDPMSLFYDRLNQILYSARLISKQNDISYNTISGILLILDGWSWNDIIFRAPIWMFDHREIPVKDARKIEGLEWLTGTSLEIKSKQNLV